ncbi:hypothetical protein NW805_09025, partial [Synechococcus sp. W60.1]|uniref:hypothetical protein n=1 Tax=Synechococcus sp. W60.1 TaxID=2964516 RepID=UPI0039C1CE5A
MVERSPKSEGGHISLTACIQKSFRAVTDITWRLRVKDPDVACSQKMPYTLPTTRLLKKGIEKVCIEELTNLNPVEQRYSLSAIDILPGLKAGDSYHAAHGWLLAQSS